MDVRQARPLIRRKALEHKMIEPFTDRQVREE